MSDSLNLDLPFLDAAQAQKHVTLNEALAMLDALVQLQVISRTLTAPPGAPAEGDRYLIAAGATGAWAGHDGHVAFRLDGVWRFAIPRVGWRLWSSADGALYVFDGAAWASPGVPSALQNMVMIGVNTTADATNKLAVSSSDVLFTHVGASQRLKLNKSAAGDTASLVFQTGFSGRAEFGATGSDDFKLKVSADGSTWFDALAVDRTSGVVSAPQGVAQLPFQTAAAPAASAAGAVNGFSTNIGGRNLLAFRGPAGLERAVQPFLGRGRVSRWVAAGGGTNTTTTDGSGGIVTGGTATVRACASTRYFTAVRRLGYVSSGAAGTSCGVVTHNTLVFWRGNAAGLGGFHALFTFGVSDAAAVADARLFAGFTSSVALIGNVNPSTLLNLVGVSCDNGQTTLRVISNDGAGAATMTDLGANFPSNTLSTDLYELALYAPPNGAAVDYRVTRLNTGHVVEGSIAANLPVNTQFLSPQVWRNSGATALAAGVDIASIYVETDY